MEVAPVTSMGYRLGALEISTVSVFGKNAATIDAAGRELERALTKRLHEGMEGAKRALVRTLDKIYADLVAKHGSPWPTGGSPWGTAPGVLAKRSGRGLKSIKASRKTEMGPAFSYVKGQISTGSMTIHETGGTVSAKGRYLTIPFREALNSKGLPLKRRARDWDNTFVRMSRRGNLIIFRKDGSGRVVPLYLLKKSVRIPQRLGLEETVENNLPYFAEKALKAIEKELRG